MLHSFFGILFSSFSGEQETFLAEWNVTPLIWAFGRALKIEEMYSSLFPLPPILILIKINMCAYLDMYLP